MIPSFDPRSPMIAQVYPEDVGQAGGLNDQEAIKKIGRHTTPTGRILTVLFIVGAIALGWFYLERSEAYEHRHDGIVAAGEFEKGSPEMLAALRKVLDTTPYADVAERAARNLGYFKDEQAVPALIKALDRGGIVRRAAALALANIGSPAADPAKQKLLEVLPDTDETDRPQVVWALAKLKEPAASDAIIDMFTRGLLQSQPGFDPKVLAEAIGIKKLSSPELTGHEDKAVRTLVATALAEAATAEIVDPLVRMIQNKDEDAEVIRAAVAGLARTGDPRAARPIFQLLEQRPDLRASALDALRKSTAAPELVTLLNEAEDVGIQRDLVRLLRQTHDPRAADALAKMAQHEDRDIRLEAAHALAELGDARAVEPLLAFARDEDDTVATDAIDALRQLAHPDAGKALLALLDEFPHRKAAILRALGSSHAVEAGPAIMKELEGDDIGAAAKALGELPYEQAYDKLVKMVVRPKDVDFTEPGVVSEMAYRNRVEAIQALRYFGKPDPRAIKVLTTVIEDPDDDFRLQRLAGVALGEIADDQTLAMMLEKIKNPEIDENVRIAYVQGLWRKPNRTLAKQLFPLFDGDTPPAIKRAAALAIGYAADPTNEEQLMAMLDSEANRRYAAIAILLGGTEKAAKKLLEVLEDDVETRDILRMAVMDPDTDDFNILSEDMFENGQVWARLQVAQMLLEGTGDKNSYSYPWTQFTTRLRAGWDGPRGMSPRAIRGKIYEKLTGDDPEMRKLAAKTMEAMNLRGLLLAARDAGIQEARQVLLALDTT